MSLQKVDLGQKIVENTNRKTKEIFAKISEIQQLISQVSVGNQTQYNAVSEINSTMSELDSTNQELNLVVDQLASSSREMNREIAHINEMLNIRFGN
ncbi:MAG: methyl-accepting chemotaxis protein [Oligoflexia bacterium]|nr:methyl-accepting chemotaxis protein [Oligoflexia bacterium]